MRRGCVLVGFMLVVLLHAAPARAASFTFESLFDPAANRLDVNVDLVDVGDLLPGTFGILGFEFDIAFNPAILSGGALPFDVQPGDFLSAVAFPFLFTLGDPFGGAVTVVSALLGPVPTGATADGRLATISFFDINLGFDPSVAISNVHVTRLIDPNVLFPEVDSVEILAPAPPAVIPEPSTLALVALGLAAMRQRRKTLRRRAVL
jgi:hypothetical protein